MALQSYKHNEIEKKWRQQWLRDGLYAAHDNDTRKKFYHLVMFAYPSGDLHIGHWYNFAPADVIARKRRMDGYNVMSPFGFDAFGLPAENAAIKRKLHPKDWTYQNIERMREQIKAMGPSYDWSREVITSDPEYYKWTQWMFLQLYEKGLAYRAEVPANWCPGCKTVLANEQVVDGKCDRCRSVVVQKKVTQWMFKITAYADELLQNLIDLDWPEKTKIMQRNWIGRSEGAEIAFRLTHTDTNIKRFVLLHGRGGSPDANFFPWLRRELEHAGYTVEAPSLPHADEPNDDEQADFVELNYTLDQETAVLGHSFGGVVALRLLERGHTFHTLITVATPVRNDLMDGKERPSVEKSLDKGFDHATAAKHVQRVVVCSDVNDGIIPEAHGLELAEKFGGMHIKVAANDMHFCGEKEPALLDACFPSIRVFTTRPDTVFGATYMVLAPEHDLVVESASRITNYDDVRKYKDVTSKKTEIERTAADKEKTGVELKGISAVNPATGEKIPIWISDYVLARYGTGAIMAVPAHDERDYQFAKKFALPIIPVISGVKSGTPAIERLAWEGIIGDHAYTEGGWMEHSGQFNGLASDVALPQMTDWAASAGWGKRTVTYKLHDWIVSRQRYWGAPIPILYCKQCAVHNGNPKAQDPNSKEPRNNIVQRNGQIVAIVPVTEKDLPVLLPVIDDYTPPGDGKSPLARSDSFLHTICPRCGGPAERETDTMDTFVDSSWYFLRYTDPRNASAFADPTKLRQWLPVDLYIGGAEHTVMHLLYARFFTKVLADLGYLPFREPFKALRHQGIILGEDNEKMSKSRGNVVDPDNLVKEFGADTVRLYLCFMGEYEQGGPWNPGGINGVHRFLQRVWKLYNSMDSSPARGEDKGGVGALQRLLHKTIKKVGDDIEALKFNTAVSALMVLLREMENAPSPDKASADAFLKLLAPLAPFMTEEIWRGSLGNADSIHSAPWPWYDPSLVEDESITLVVQINGKMRGSVVLPRDTDESSAFEAIKNDAKLNSYLADAVIKKTVYVKNRILNIIL